MDDKAAVLALVRRRQGQPKFRADLIRAYGGQCAMSGCAFLPLLEAAHIFPYRGDETNHVTNGLLLRADLHTLFDLRLIAVRPDGSLDICPSLKGTEYEGLASIVMPKIALNRPSLDALEWHRRTGLRPRPEPLWQGNWVPRDHAGEPSTIETCDLLIKSQLLYQLSYGPDLRRR